VRTLFFIVAAVLMAQEGMAQQKPDTPGSKPEKAVPTNANLFIYRAYAQPTAWGTSVKVDGKSIISLPNRSYTAISVPPGSHIIKLSWPFLSGQSNSSMTLDVKAAERYYVEVTGISQYAGGGPGAMYFNMGSGIAQAKPEHALELLKTCCKFKAGK
jgi:hypothetical protein